MLPAGKDNDQDKRPQQQAVPDKGKKALTLQIAEQETDADHTGQCGANDANPKGKTDYLWSLQQFWRLDQPGAENDRDRQEK